MGAVWYRARAELRRTVTTTILLTLVVAVTGGIVLAAVAGALRGRAALPDFLEYNNASDISVFSYAGSLPADEERQLVDDLVALPEWQVVRAGRPVVVSLRVDGEWVATFSNAVIDGPYLTEIARPILVEGRLPDFDREDEVVVNEALAEAAALDAGGTLDLRTISPALLDAVTSGETAVDTDGEPVTMTVTGIVRSPVDLSLDQAARKRLGSDSWFLALGPAFVERFEGQLATFGVGVEGRSRPGQREQLTEALIDLGGPGVSVEQGNQASELVGSVERAIDFETKALLAFALVTLVSAAALVGQALGRRASLDLDDNEALSSAGMRRRERATVPMARALVVGLAGALGATAIAIATSTAFPIGVARRAERTPGIDVDPAVVGWGALLLAIAVMSRVAVAGWRAAALPTTNRPTGRERASPVSRLAAAAGLPITVETGARMAVERGRGQTSVPVLGATIAVAVGVLALTATLVLTASLDRLIGTPALQGWTWDTAIGNLSNRDAVAATTARLRANEQVDGFIGFSSGTIVIDSEDSYAAAFGRGDRSVRPPAIEGRLPDAVDEVAVGVQTLDAIGKEIGDRVTLSAAPGAPGVEARIVGTLVLPAGLDTQLTLGRGAVMTGEGLAAVYGPDEQWVPNTFLVDFTEGTSTAEGEASVTADLGDSSRFSFAPDVENLRRVQRLPRLLAALLGLLGLGTLANVLVTSIRRRRRDLATYAAIGFRRRQLAATVAWQATTFALLALVVGVPLGVAAGRAVWRLLTGSIGSTTDPVVPTALLALVVVGTLVAANLIAALPARAAARTRPAQILRSE